MAPLPALPPAAQPVRARGGSESTVLLYHERQESAHCGTHALNALLQGPLLDEVALSGVAEDLDRRELEVLAESPGAAQAAAFHRRPSRRLAAREQLEGARRAAAARQESWTNGGPNVGPDGNFSYFVLSEALGAFGCELLTPEQAAEQGAPCLLEPHREAGFLLNRDAHWYALRPVGGVWYDFNSLQAAPTALSELHLAAVLAQLRAERWSVFVVRGNLPAGGRDSQREEGAAVEGRGRYLTPQTAQAELAADAASQADEASLAAALQASASEASADLERRRSVEDAQLAAAIAASLSEVQQQRAEPRM